MRIQGAALATNQYYDILEDCNLWRRVERSYVLVYYLPCLCTVLEDPLVLELLWSLQIREHDAQQ
jgi:hypothetical protein